MERDYTLENERRFRLETKSFTAPIPSKHIKTASDGRPFIPNPRETQSRRYLEDDENMFEPQQFRDEQPNVSNHRRNTSFNFQNVREENSPRGRDNFRTQHQVNHVEFFHPKMNVDFQQVPNRTNTNSMKSVSSSIIGDRGDNDRILTLKQKLSRKYGLPDECGLPAKFATDLINQMDYRQSNYSSNRSGGTAGFVDIYLPQTKVLDQKDRLVQQGRVDIPFNSNQERDSGYCRPPISKNLSFQQSDRPDHSSSTSNYSNGCQTDSEGETCSIGGRSFDDKSLSELSRKRQEVIDRILHGASSGLQTH
jgi:hypothetical protein